MVKNYVCIPRGFLIINVCIKGRHQFQILQIWKARITDAFVSITEDMLENTWRETDYRLDVLRATKGARVEVY